MAGTFACIGLRFHDDDDLNRIVTTVADRGTEVVPVAEGSYRGLCSDSGAEVWMQCDSGGDWTGLNPWFHAEETVPVRVEDVRRPDGFPPLERRVRAWMLDQSTDSSEGLYPFEFDAIDGARYDAWQLPAAARARLAAFALEIEVADGGAASVGGVRLAPQSLIPASLFDEQEGTQPRLAYVRMSGIVQRAAVKANEFGGPYHWLAVETYGATLDIVVDIDRFSAPPPAGSIVHGSFWLCGRLEG
jgi:hypothetical protein